MGDVGDVGPRPGLAALIASMTVKKATPITKYLAWMRETESETAGFPVSEQDSEGHQNSEDPAGSAFRAGVRRYSSPTGIGDRDGGERSADDAK